MNVDTERLALALGVLSNSTIRRISPDPKDTERLRSFVSQDESSLPVDEIARRVINRELEKRRRVVARGPA
jgi:hypothetical protein